MGLWSLSEKRERVNGMRRLPAAIAVVTVVSSLAVVSSAPAEPIMSVQKFTGKASPSRAGTKSKPAAVSLTGRAYFDTIAPDLDRQVQFATVDAELYLSKDGITNNRKFPSCTPAKVLLDENTCPSGSKVGAGTGRGIGLGLDETVTVDVYNLPKGRGIVMLIVGESPLIIREVVVGALTKIKGDKRYGWRVSFTVPRNLQSPAPGVIAAVKDFKITIPRQYLKKHGKVYKYKSGSRKGQKVPYIATVGCTGGRWWAKLTAKYTTTFDGALNGGSQTVESSQRCTGIVTKSASVRGARLTLTVPSGCVDPGGRLSASVTWKRKKVKHNRFVRVRRTSFYIGSKRVRTDGRSPFRQKVKLASSAKAGSTVTLRARVYTKVSKGRAPTKTITTKVGVCA